MIYSVLTTSLCNFYYLIQLVGGHEGELLTSDIFQVGDQHRRYLLELMLTKTRYAAGEGSTESSSGESSAMLLMCEYLMRCPITSGRDIVIVSFLCSMVPLIVTGSDFLNYAMRL